jgi:hypothetical protein
MTFSPKEILLYSWSIIRTRHSFRRQSEIQQIREAGELRLRRPRDVKQSYQMSVHNELMNETSWFFCAVLNER